MRMRNMWSLLSGQDPASSLDCLTVFPLEYPSTENKLPLFAPGARLSPASKPGLSRRYSNQQKGGFEREAEHTLKYGKSSQVSV